MQIFKNFFKILKSFKEYLADIFCYILFPQDKTIN